MDSELTEFKKGVKQWLKSQGLNYSWIAEQCGVSEITVRNWMSQKHIPTLRRQLLERVMMQLPQQDAPAATTTAEVPGLSVNAGFTLTIQLSGDIYNRLLARAGEEESTVEQLVANAISNLAKPAAAPIMRSRKLELPGM